MKLLWCAGCGQALDRIWDSREIHLNIGGKYKGVRVHIPTNQFDKYIDCGPIYKWWEKPHLKYSVRKAIKEQRLNMIKEMTRRAL